MNTIYDKAQVLTDKRTMIHHETTTLERLLQSQYGLTVPQYEVLAMTCDEGRLKMGAMSNRLGLSRGNMTAVVDRLVAKGLLHRTRQEGADQDRRQVIVTPTEAGSSIYDDTKRTPAA
jgi:DNA-binding MarR family transcriptional regulator